jgi:hypothetical protein
MMSRILFIIAPLFILCVMFSVGKCQAIDQGCPINQEKPNEKVDPNHQCP